MTENLTMRQAKWLTYLVWILIMLLTGTVMFQFNLIRDQNVRLGSVENSITNLPNIYIRAERYKADLETLYRHDGQTYSLICKSIDRIDAKLDRLIEEHSRKNLN